MLSIMMQGCLTWACIANHSAEYHQIDPRLLKAIIMVESSGCKNLQNKHTKATGCMQIHPVHIPDRLALEMLKNPKYGIPEGAKLLKEFKTVCQYNLGKAGARKNKEACKRYMNKLKRYGVKNEKVQ